MNTISSADNKAVKPKTGYMIIPYIVRFIGLYSYELMVKISTIFKLSVMLPDLRPFFFPERVLVIDQIL